MATYTAASASFVDDWLAQVNGAGGWTHNGAGPRLGVGKYVTGGTTLVQRVLLSIPVGPLFAAIHAASDITAAPLVLTARGTHSCISIGSSPKVWFQRRTSGSASENSESSECNLVGSVTFPTLTGTSQVGYENSSLAAGDTVTVDLVAMLRDLYTSNPSATTLEIGIVAKDETDTTQRLAFNSRSSGTSWSFSATYSTASTPATPGSLSPSNTRLVGGTSRTFYGDYSNSDGSAMNDAEILVATSSHVDGNGKLDTSLVTVTGSGWTPYVIGSISSGLWQAPRTVTTQTRGVRYYWQCRVSAVSGTTSAWSAVKFWDVNRLPTVSVP